VAFAGFETPLVKIRGPVGGTTPNRLIEGEELEPGLEFDECCEEGAVVWGVTTIGFEPTKARGPRGGAFPDIDPP
jgi:hypothetical protein